MLGNESLKNWFLPCKANVENDKNKKNGKHRYAEQKEKINNTIFFII